MVQEPREMGGELSRLASGLLSPKIVASPPTGKAIHVIADNLSALKTKLVEAFLEAHPKVCLHFTPTYSSCPNQVENWFARIQRHVIARGVFRSLLDLRSKLLRYIRHLQKNGDSKSSGPIPSSNEERNRSHFMFTLH